MPAIFLDKCIRCMKCVNDCPSSAITIETGDINSSCIHCGHCVAICPEKAVEPDFGAILPLEELLVKGEDFVRLSSHIRSCRSYLQKTLTKNMLEVIVENMKHYPSASNARPVQVSIVQSPEMVKRLNDLTANSLIKTLKLVTNPIVTIFLKVFVPSFKVEALNKYKNQFIKRQTENSSQVCHHAPVVMLFHAPKSKFGMAKDDALIWATYTSIYAKSMGLGTCFIGFIIKAMERSRAMREAFNIPKDNCVHAALTIGYPNVKYLNQASRKAPEHTVL